MTISDREEQQKNAQSLILVTLLGMTISAKSEQPTNALFPMLVTLSFTFALGNKFKRIG